ncbi:MAG: hypothetical protein J0L86_11660 [Flavobacteriales bacterium]|nr:hypothetical protein [Flavobacteriales bacterium]
MLPIHIETKNDLLKEINEVPFIGEIVILLYSALPLVLLMMANRIFDLIDDVYVKNVDVLIAGLWNIFLHFKKDTKMSIFTIPCWILYTVVGVIKLIIFIAT